MRQAVAPQAVLAVPRPVATAPPGSLEDFRQRALQQPGGDPPRGDAAAYRSYSPSRGARQEALSTTGLAATAFPEPATIPPAALVAAGYTAPAAPQAQPATSVGAAATTVYTGPGARVGSAPSVAQAAPPASNEASGAIEPITTLPLMRIFGDAPLPPLKPEVSRHPYEHSSKPPPSMGFFNPREMPIMGQSMGPGMGGMSMASMQPRNVFVDRPFPVPNPVPVPVPVQPMVTHIWNNLHRREVADFPYHDPAYGTGWRDHYPDEVDEHWLNEMSMHTKTPLQELFLRKEEENWRDLWEAAQLGTSEHGWRHRPLPFSRRVRDPEKLIPKQADFYTELLL